jgi:hypothetical protein
MNLHCHKNLIYCCVHTDRLRTMENNVPTASSQTDSNQVISHVQAGHMDNGSIHPQPLYQMRVSGQLHALTLYSRRKSPWYPLDSRMDGLHSQSGCFWHEIHIFLAPAGNWTTIPGTHSPYPSHYTDYAKIHASSECNTHFTFQDFFFRWMYCET